MTKKYVFNIVCNYSQNKKLFFRTKIILMPSISSEELKMLSAHFFDKEFITNITSMKIGEFFYCLLEYNSASGTIKGVAKAIPLSKEEIEFINKRMKRYNKEFDKEKENL